MSNDSIHDSASPVKLTPAQRSILQMLDNGTTIEKWTGALTWHTKLIGKPISRRTIDNLLKAGLISVVKDKTGNYRDYDVLHITADGIAALDGRL